MQQRRITAFTAALVLLAGFGCAGLDEAAPAHAGAPPKPAPGKPPAPPAPTAPAPAAAAWDRLEPGLEIAAFRSRLAAAGDRLVNVLRIDPARFRLRLMNASSEPEGRPRTVRDWSERYHLTAAI